MRCYYCKMPFNTDDPSSSYYWTVDHKIPRSRGGKGGRNKVYACRRCNEEKGARTPAEYRQWLAEQAGTRI